MKNVQDFNNDIMLKYDVNLDIQLKGSSNKVNVFFERVKMIVYQEIKSNNPSFNEADLDDVVKDELWNAILEQAYYLIYNYDMNIVGGFDPITGATVPIDEIRKRSFSPLAKTILTNAGLLYRGISDYPYVRDYARRGWR